MDDSNGDFEIVDKKMASSPVNSPSDSSPNTSLLASVQPPTALPSFITSQGSPISRCQHVSSPMPVLPQSPSVISPSKSSDISPYPLTAKSSTPTPGTPVTIQPLPPIGSHSVQQNPVLPADMPPKDTFPEGETGATIPSSVLSESPPGNGWMGWIRGTVQSVGHKVAEKAKSSMDSMITTLDPQMKDFINSGGDIDIVVASDKEVKVSPIKEAFQKTFGKATVSGLASQSGKTAAQPVGFEAVLKSAEERINSLRNSPGNVHPQQPVVAVENFLVELTPEYWVEMGLLLLDDPWHDFILQTYTQPIPIPDAFIQELQKSTPDHYPLRDTGFSTTIGQVASTYLNVHHTLWQETLTGIPRREFLLTAAKVLAELYRSRLPKNVI